MNFFLSITNPYRKDQVSFENELKDFFIKKGINLITVSCLCNKGETPLKQIIIAINECEAVVALAFDRKHVYLEYSKEFNLVQRLEERDKYYTSPWLHMECAIAKSLNKPLIILVPKYVYAEGVLDFTQDDYKIISIEHQTSHDGFPYRLLSLKKQVFCQKELCSFIDKVLNR